MTVVGADATRIDETIVSSVGAGPWDGWTKVVEIPQSALPVQSATAAYAVFAWCGFGRIEGSLLGNGNATIEIGLGTTAGPEPLDAYRIPLRTPLFFEGTSPLRSLTASFAHAYYVGHTAAWRQGVDTTTKGFAVWARIALNGDPPGSVSASFKVGARGLVAFALGALGSTDWAHDYWRSGPGQNLNGSPNPPQPGSRRTFHVSSFVNIFDGNDDWVVFSSANVWPDWSFSVNAIPWWELRLDKGGLGSTFEGILGREQRWAAHPLVPAGQGGVSGAGAKHQQSTGGFAILQSPENGDQFAFSGVDRNPTGFTSATSGIETFAIRSTALGFFRSAQKDRPSVASLFNDFSVPSLTYEAAEWSRPFEATGPLLFTAKWFRRNAGGYTGELDHLLWILTNTSATTSRGLAVLAPNATPTRYVDEGVESILGTLVHNLRPDEVQFRFLALSNPNGPLVPNPIGRDPADFCAVSWIWENDPDYTPSTAPAVPPITAIVPERESLDLGSLSALSILPERDSIQEVPFRKLREFRSDDGTPARWPAWLKVAGAIDLQWNGLSYAEKETVLSEIRQAFKWTHPYRGTEHALLLDGVPDVLDLGAFRFAVRASFVELIWLGSGA